MVSEYFEIIRTEGLRRTFGSVKALSRGDLSIGRGEITALVGNNGAGKSTLIKCITGALKPDCGTISTGGRSFSSLTVSTARSLGIATVYQDLALVDSLDVSSNIWLGMEPLLFGVMVNRKEMNRRSRELLRQFSIEIPSIHQKVASLSGGQRQAIAIARAIAQGGQILILDEPTAAMGTHEKKKIEDLLKALKSEGTTILYISHDLQQVLDIADSVVVMRAGETVEKYPSCQLDLKSLTALMAGTNP